MQEMQPHPLANIFWVNLVGFGRILGKIKTNLGKIEAKFGQIWLDILDKIKILHPPKHSTSYGDAITIPINLCILYNKIEQ